MDYYLITPLLFILRIVEVFSEFTLALEIVNIKASLKRLFFGTILFATLFEIAKIFTFQYLSSILSSTLAILIIMIVFKVSVKKSMMLLISL